ncbi:MAG: hypothetical protein J6K17_13255 [Oscillospiraceae bacterium]|nr:hypothetical protein [Oscillospiraceae bacterium]
MLLHKGIVTYPYFSKLCKLAFYKMATEEKPKRNDNSEIIFIVLPDCQKFFERYINMFRLFFRIEFIYFFFLTEDGKILLCLMQTQHQINITESSGSPAEICKRKEKPQIFYDFSEIAWAGLVIVVGEL